MKTRKRSASFTLAGLCIFTLLLAGCRGASSTNKTTRTTSRLTSLQQTPTSGATATPVGAQTYLGQVPGQNAWIGITTDGKNANAFITDGTQGHSATFAQWFRGAVSNNSIDTTAAGKNGKDRLQAMLTNTSASGTVTMTGGQSIVFTANALPSSAGSPTPSATGTATVSASPSVTGTATTGLNPGVYKGTGSSNGNNYEAGWLVIPANMVSGTATPSATATVTQTPGATATTSATPTTTASPTTGMQQAGAVINTKTHDVTTAPVLTANDVSNGSVSVPNVGNLKLTPCQGNQC